MTSARLAYASTFSPRGVAIACTACGSSRRWRGHEDAHRAGWAWRLAAGRLAWTCAECATAATYPLVWRVRTRLAERFGQRCRVLVRGALNSALVEFADGYRVVTCRYYVRRPA